MSAPPDDGSSPVLIRIRVTARQKKDASALLTQVREAMKANNIRLRVETVPDKTAPPAESPLQRNAELEEAIIRVAAAVLDEKAREIEKQKAPVSANPTKVAATKKSLRKWLWEKAAAGWHVKILSAAVWVLRKTGF
jgi:hypothetical protein